MAGAIRPFGERLSQIAVNDDKDGYTGHIFDKATGLNYMQARYYDPLIGRFLSIDPLGFESTGDPGMFNRYAYVHNDPINGWDPFGEQACEGVKGKCFESSNFDEGASDGQTVTQGQNVDKAMVETLGSSEGAPRSEAVFGFTENEDGSIDVSEGTNTKTNGGNSETAETTSRIPSDSTSTGHIHRDGPNSTVSPGRGDDKAVNDGRPNGIGQKGRVLVVEKVNGQFRARLLKGKLRREGRGSRSRVERDAIKKRLNQFQERTQE